MASSEYLSPDQVTMVRNATFHTGRALTLDEEGAGSTELLIMVIHDYDGEEFVLAFELTDRFKEILLSEKFHDDLKNFAIDK